jgi:hypothetical protein
MCTIEGREGRDLVILKRQLPNHHAKRDGWEDGRGKGHRVRERRERKAFPQDVVIIL